MYDNKKEVREKRRKNKRKKERKKESKEWRFRVQLLFIPSFLGCDLRSATKNERKKERKI